MIKKWHLKKLSIILLTIKYTSAWITFVSRWTHTHIHTPVPCTHMHACVYSNTQSTYRTAALSSPARSRQRRSVCSAADIETLCSGVSRSSAGRSPTGPGKTPATCPRAPTHLHFLVVLPFRAVVYFTGFVEVERWIRSGCSKLYSSSFRVNPAVNAW